MSVPVTERAHQLERSAMERALDRAAGGRAIAGNAITHLTDGPDAFAAMYQVIDAAKRWVHFENYIINDDVTGRRFADRLMASARRGVAASGRG